MPMSQEELENCDWVQQHKDLYAPIIERAKFSDKGFWEDLDEDLKNKIKAQMSRYCDKPVWRML